MRRPFDPDVGLRQRFLIDMKFVPSSCPRTGVDNFGMKYRYYRNYYDLHERPKKILFKGGVLRCISMFVFSDWFVILSLFVLVLVLLLNIPH